MYYGYVRVVCYGHTILCFTDMGNRKIRAARARSAPGSMLTVANKVPKEVSRFCECGLFKFLWVMNEDLREVVKNLCVHACADVCIIMMLISLQVSYGINKPSLEKVRIRSLFLEVLLPFKLQYLNRL